MNYLALRGDAPGYLFFLLQYGQLLSRNILMDWLRQIMASARVPGNFSSHSFRIGAATVVACNGVLDHYLIQSMGRWSNNACQLYIRAPGLMGVLATPASHLSLVPIASCSWVLDLAMSASVGML